MRLLANIPSRRALSQEDRVDPLYRSQDKTARVLLKWVWSAVLVYRSSPLRDGGRTS